MLLTFATARVPAAAICPTPCADATATAVVTWTRSSAMGISRGIDINRAGIRDRGIGRAARKRELAYALSRCNRHGKR